MMTYFTATELTAINAFDWQTQGRAAREQMIAFLGLPENEHANGPRSVELAGTEATPSQPTA